MCSLRPSFMIAEWLLTWFWKTTDILEPVTTQHTGMILRRKLFLWELGFLGIPFTQTKLCGMSPSQKGAVKGERCKEPSLDLQWKLSATQSWRTKHIVTATSPNDHKDSESGENVPSVRKGWTDHMLGEIRSQGNVRPFLSPQS